jgi:dienelactone hydrolase
MTYQRTKWLGYDEVEIMVEENAIKKIIMITVAFFVFFLVLGLIGQAFAQPKIEGSNVSYTAGGVQMIGYLAYDTSIQGRRPGVLVVHEWWGLNDYARMRARMLAELGYTALALDMYGGDKVATHPEDAQKFSSELMKNFDLAKERFLAGMDFLKKQPTVDPTRVAAIGYCFGGGIVLNMARQGVDLKGVASFHGNLTAIKPAQPGGIKAKILVLHGGADKFSTPEQIEAFKKEMTAAGVDFRFITYPGAMHSFTNPEADAMGKKFNMPIGYNAQADKESWNELKKFLKAIFGK